MTLKQAPTRHNHSSRHADVSRRRFLAAGSAGTIGLALPWFSSRTTAGDTQFEPPCLLLNASHIYVELRIMRDHFLPFLLRRVQWDHKDGRHRLLPAKRATLDAFCQTINGLSALIIDPDRPCERRDIARVVGPARRHLGKVQRSYLLQPCAADKDFVAPRCFVDGNSAVWVWKCASGRFWMMPEDKLESYWQDIRQLLGMPENARPEELRFLETRRFVNAFWNLSEDEYFAMMYPLVQLFPSFPYQLFCIPDRKYATDGYPLSGLRSIRDRLSFLMTETMERLADNSFMQLGPLVKRDEMCGSWMGFTAGQVLDVLYHKTLVVTWIRNRLNAGHPVFLDHVRNLVQPSAGAHGRRCSARCAAAVKRRPWGR